MGKRKQLKTVDHNAAVQFRPGEALGRVLANYAQRWDVTVNEAGKRLAALAAHGFRADDYAAILELATAVGGPQDFVASCQQLQSAVCGANQAGEHAYDKLPGPEKLAFLQRTVKALLETRTAGSRAKGGTNPTTATQQRHIEL